MKTCWTEFQTVKMLNFVLDVVMVLNFIYCQMTWFWLTFGFHEDAKMKVDLVILNVDTSFLPLTHFCVNPFNRYIKLNFTYCDDTVSSLKMWNFIGCDGWMVWKFNDVNYQNSLCTPVYFAIVDKNSISSKNEIRQGLYRIINVCMKEQMKHHTMRKKIRSSTFNITDFKWSNDEWKRIVHDGCRIRKKKDYFSTLYCGCMQI